MDLRIEEAPDFKENFDERMKMLCFVVKASSFLWHQVLICKKTILFMFILLKDKMHDGNFVFDW